MRLEDILVAIEGVREFIGTLDFESYKANFLVRRGVHMCLLIISEAVRHIPDDMTSAYPQLPWHAIRSIGNRLRHEYGKTDDFIIWNIATQSLPELEPIIRAMYDSVSSGSAPEA